MHVIKVIVIWSYFRAWLHRERNRVYFPKPSVLFNVFCENLKMLQKRLSACLHWKRQGAAAVLKGSIYVGLRQKSTKSPKNNIKELLSLLATSRTYRIFYIFCKQLAFFFNMTRL